MPTDESTRRHHLVLLGLMGAGKSTIGMLTAHDSQCPFVDSDSLVELHTGMSPVELEANEGVDRLHDAEIEALRRVLCRRDPIVFAAAASVVDRVERDELGAARVVWLDVDPEVLAQRVAAGHPRPVLGDDAAATLAAQARERRPRARQLADLWVDEDDRGPVEIAEEIVAWFSCGRA